MKLSQPGNLAKPLLPSCASEMANFCVITMEAEKPIEQDRVLFQACTCLGIPQKYLI